MNRIPPLFVLLMAAVACQGQPGGEVTAPASSVAPPSMHELGSATYAGIQEQPVTLTDGLWRGAPYVESGSSAPSVGLVGDFRVTGDVDGDGSDETVVLLWSGSGGSGTFRHIAVAGRDAHGAVVIPGTLPLGDRVQVVSAEILDQQIIFNVIEAGPDDAACCPGQKFRRTFVLKGGGMEEVTRENLGRLSLADLGGEWKLLQFSRVEDVSEGIGITLVFEGDRIAGYAGCNRYSGSMRAAETPGAIHLDGPMAVTRMMCPAPQMDAEQRYLRALEKVTQYSFAAGKLVLVWSGEEGMGMLSFGRSEDPEKPLPEGAN